MTIFGQNQVYLEKNLKVDWACYDDRHLITNHVYQKCCDLINSINKDYAYKKCLRRNSILKISKLRLAIQ